MGAITVVKDFTFVADNGQSFNFDWFGFPAEHQNAQIVVLVKSRIGASAANVQFKGSMDTDSESNVGSVILTGAPGSTAQDVATGLMPMLRVNISATNTCQIVLSIYITPKSA